MQVWKILERWSKKSWIGCESKQLGKEINSWMASFHDPVIAFPKPKHGKTALELWE